MYEEDVDPHDFSNESFLDDNQDGEDELGEDELGDGEQEPAIIERTTEASWFLFDEPYMDEMYDDENTYIEEIIKSFEIEPCVIGSDKKIFLARYEIPIYDKEFLYYSAPLSEVSVGFIDFLSGISYGSCELTGVMGEISSNPENIIVKTGCGGASPPFPETMFEEVEEDRTVFNLFWLTKIKNENVKMTLLSSGASDNNLAGEPEPSDVHWWTRVDWQDGKDLQFPVPGEFVSLLIVIAPYLPWGNQKSSPFIFSGNWIETVFYTNCKIIEALDLTEETPYPTYTVEYPRTMETFTARSTDFACYEVEDRVTILRETDNTKLKSWTWKNMEESEFDEESWMIAPVDFYGKLMEYNEKKDSDE